jgi:hypothetical protein
MAHPITLKRGLEIELKVVLILSFLKEIAIPVTI